ncbi:hypothetical protein K503DRAFT_362147 [Rhizopogon vinicolor AM-OR11-026]|uniref:Uncharacterized protein n=1 Tax=Rhizopogon vinicolor AM-OR11-026 TaxID=1314800 RepID=A0A1B7NBV9_9AGAM|nr:hypothetical protein K503DRAFT_362147 [Rhizopogon vinicolor AM-OR11-026]
MSRCTMYFDIKSRVSCVLSVCVRDERSQYKCCLMSHGSLDLNLMAARRMDISALLCDDDDDDDNNNDNDVHLNSPFITHPVILAPHLRGNHARRMPTTPSSNHNYIPGPRDVPLSSSPTTQTSPTESMSDAHHRPRTIDALLHHSPRAPRPSSSHSHSSVNALLNPHPLSCSLFTLYRHIHPIHRSLP